MHVCSVSPGVVLWSYLGLTGWTFCLWTRYHFKCNGTLRLGLQIKPKSMTSPSMSITHNQFSSHIIYSLRTKPNPTMQVTTPQTHISLSLSLSYGTRIWMMSSGFLPSTGMPLTSFSSSPRWISPAYEKAKWVEIYIMKYREKIWTYYTVCKHINLSEFGPLQLL